MIDPQTIAPEPGYVLVKVIEFESTIGNIKLMASGQEQSCYAEVIADGGLDRDQLKLQFNDEFEPGTMLIVGRWAGTTLEDEAYKILKRSDVFAKILVPKEKR